MASTLRDLRVWQEAVATAGEVARLARKASRPETRVLTDLLVRCAAEVALSIARAYVKEQPVAQREALNASRDAVAALETGIAIARHAQLLPPPACAELAQRAGVVGRMLTGYAGYLDRVVEADAEAALGRPAAPAAPLAEALDEVHRA